MATASMRSNGEDDLTGEKQGDATPKKHPTLSFVIISDPEQTKHPAARRLVRSQAARQSQPTNRRPRKPPLPVVGSGVSGSARTGRRSQIPAGSLDRKAADRRGSVGMEGISGVQERRLQGNDTQSEFGAHFARTMSLLKGERHGVMIPSPATLLTAARRDPFNSYIRKVSVFEEFLMDHYITVALPHHFCPHGAWSVIGKDEYRHKAARDWVSFLLTDTALMCALLLAGSRALSVFYDTERKDFYERIALHYKGQVLRAVGESIGQERDDVSDATIVKSLALALDDSMIEDFVSLRRHILAVRRMVEMRGGCQKLGLNGFLELTVRNFVETDELVSMEV